MEKKRQKDVIRHILKNLVPKIASPPSRLVHTGGKEADISIKGPCM